MLNDIKDSKEKEERTNIYKEKTKENEKAKFTPSLTSSKEEKPTKFAPKLTSDETNIKKNSFTPSNEPSKKEKTKNFTPNTIADPKKKTRDFSPTFELKENKGKSFKPELIEKQVISRQRKKYTINDMKMIAKEKGGDCLSQKYINNKTNLRWRCDEGHEWNANPDNIKNKGTWCPECAGRKKLTIKDMHELAESRGGKCLSEEYSRSHNKLKWQCSKGHEWEAASYSIKNQGTWCPECAGNKKYTIKDMHELAKSRSGECLSKNYLGAREKHKWRCTLGHEWEATPSNIKTKNSWCPKCSEATDERITRQFYEALFDKEFKKAYPPWLLSPKGNRMHLDGYNEALKLAFEHQGSQHYNYSQFFHKTKENFLRIQQHDKLKGELCKQHGVKLMNVPHTVKVEEREKFIRSEAKKLGIKAPMSKNKIDYEKFRYNTEDKLKQMQELALSRGGKLLSKKYINAITNLEWKCEKGHTWKACSNNVKNNAKGREGLKGNWCPKCAQRKKYTIDEVKEFAQTKGGECLSNTYKRARGILKWRCENHHEFNASFSNVNTNNSWCPECKKDKQFKKYKDLAIDRGGKCISESYDGAHLKLRWKCDKDHEWMATPNSINQGSWCPECVGHHTYTIEDMKHLAKSYGGECLSEEYSGTKKYLKWRCNNGHEWEATPNNIKSHNNWCPTCKVENKKN
jgi:hypothetical protein